MAIRPSQKARDQIFRALKRMGDTPSKTSGLPALTYGMSFRGDFEGVVALVKKLGFTQHSFDDYKETAVFVQKFSVGGSYGRDFGYIHILIEGERVDEITVSEDYDLPRRASGLREALVRLAHAKPELRSHLLPLLTSKE